jgi:hypothetical protein
MESNRAYTNRHDFFCDADCEAKAETQTVIKTFSGCFRLIASPGSPIDFPYD